MSPLHSDWTLNPQLDPLPRTSSPGPSPHVPRARLPVTAPPELPEQSVGHVGHLGPEHDLMVMDHHDHHDSGIILVLGTPDALDFEEGIQRQLLTGPRETAEGLVSS